MKDAALSELIWPPGHAVLHKPVCFQIHAAPGVFRQRWYQWQNTAEAVGALLKIGVTEYQTVLHEPAESLLAQQRMWDKSAGQNVALHGNGWAVMYGGAIGPCEPVKADSFVGGWI